MSIYFCKLWEYLYKRIACLTTIVFQVPLLVLSKTVKYLCVTLENLVQVRTYLGHILLVRLIYHLASGLLHKVVTMS